MENPKKEKVVLSKDDIDGCLINDTWDFGNDVLHKLCSDNPLHQESKIITAKVWLIGRSYAVAIERFAKMPGDPNNEELYRTVIPKIFKESDIDGHLNRLRESKEKATDNLMQSLETHNYLIEVLNEITHGQNKRSFCSKYLHFHLPDKFFIYDNMAFTSLGKLQNKIKIPEDIQLAITSKKVDKEYAEFCYKCLVLKRKIETDFNRILSNRQLDNLLLNIANNGK